MKTVFTRIITAMLMLSCLMLLVQGGINYGYQLASLEKWHKDIADEFESKLLYMINKAELFPLDASSYSLQALVEKALEDDRILRAVMYNTDGKELFSLSSIISRESEKPHNFMGNIQVMQSFSQKDTSFPIHIDESQIGYLTITTLAPSRYDITRNFFNKTIWIFLISLPVSLLSAVAVSFILSRRLASVPIKLSREISSLAKGNRSVQFSKSNIYEFSLISDAASILQQELLKSQRSRTQFMSNLAHDLRTPVAAMNVQIEGVLEGVFPPSKQVFSHLQTQLTLLHEKIDAFLKISHLESPDYVIKPIRVNLGKTVESVLEELDKQISQKQLQLKVRLDKNLWVMADSELIRLAILQIIQNLVQFSEIHSSASITLTAEGKSAALVCENAGQIASKDPEELFDHLVKENYSRNTPGNGLGLTIARKIITLHGGLSTLRNKQGHRIQVSMLLPLDHSSTV